MREEEGRERGREGRRKGGRFNEEMGKLHLCAQPVSVLECIYVSRDHGKKESSMVLVMTKGEKIEDLMLDHQDNS